MKNQPQPGKPKPQKPTTVKQPKPNAKAASTGPKSKLGTAPKYAPHKVKNGKASQWPKVPATPKGRNKKAASGKPYDWLAPLTPAQIAKQAKATITTAYKPDFSNIDQEQSRLTAINNKRTQDNQAYEQWLATQQNLITQQSNANDLAFANAIGQSNSMAQSALGTGQTTGLVTAANARAGNVSNNATSNAIGTGAGSDVSQNEKSDIATIGGVNSQAAANVQTGGDLLRANSVNNLNTVQSNSENDTANFNTQLATLAQDRSKLRLSQSGDIAKEISRLQGVEIQKAQAQQDYAAAAQKLGVDTKEFNTDTKIKLAQLQQSAAALTEKAKEFSQTQKNDVWKEKFEALTRVNIAKLESKTQLTEAELRKASEDKTFLLDAKKDGWEEAATKWKEQHPNAGKSSSSSKGGGKNYPSLSVGQKDNGASAIHNVATNYSRYLKKFKGDAGKAQAAIKKQYAGQPDAIVNAGLEIATRGGIGAGTWHKLNTLGYNTLGASFKKIGKAGSKSGAKPRDPTFGGHVKAPAPGSNNSKGNPSKAF